MMTDPSENRDLQSLSNLMNYAPLSAPGQPLKETADPKEALVSISDIDKQIEEAGDNQELKDALLRFRSDLGNVEYRDRVISALGKHRQDYAIGFLISGPSAEEVVLLAKKTFPSGEFKQDNGHYRFDICTNETPRNAKRLSQDLDRIRGELTDWLRERNIDALLYRREGLEIYWLT